MTDTIYALSSGNPPSGVAVLRISGPQSRFVVEMMCASKAFGTPVFLSEIKNPIDNQLLDKGIVLTFVAPASFTGEDVVEFHVHGGSAVINALLEALSGIDGLRAAEAGEFTYRAFLNGKVDLTQAEGIADLIDSEGEAQRVLALNNVEGEAFAVIDSWSENLLRMRALIEAEIDFVDEDDIPGSVSDQVWAEAGSLVSQMEQHLEQAKRGEIVRDGFHVALLGRPNAGKSTLLNCLAKREVAIVSDIPGTTRDVVEIKLNLGGQIVFVSDTAGIRETEGQIEKEGIRRAREVADRSHMSIWLHAADDSDGLDIYASSADIVVMTKCDLEKRSDIACALRISADQGIGITELVDRIERNARTNLSSDEPMLFGRKRQKDHLVIATKLIKRASIDDVAPLEIRAEYLRSAATELGKIVGMRDNEDILGAIFSEFCVGK